VRLNTSVYFFICGQVLDMVKTRCAWAANFYKVQVRVDFFFGAPMVSNHMGQFFFQSLFIYPHIELGKTFFPNPQICRFFDIRIFFLKDIFIMYQ